MKIQRLPSKLILLFILLTFSTSLVHHKVPTKPFKHNTLVAFISTKYNIEYSRAKEIVIIAEEHSEKNKFPRLHDTLAIIGIESSYKETAVSKCNAKGLMQILYKKVSFDPKLNIVAGTDLLKDYIKRLPTKDAAVQAYNVGIANFNKGIRNKDYLTKFKQEKERLKNADLF